MKKYILITGCAGFIGFHLSLKLLSKYNVFGIDNMNNYYDLKLKKNRLTILQKKKNFSFHKIDLINFNDIKNTFKKKKFSDIIHLAAQAGVQHSLKKPEEYLTNNIDAFFNIVKFSKLKNIKRVIYASSSSVYGKNKKLPFYEKQKTDSPLSIYAASKIMNELMAHTYSYLNNTSFIGLRFFTVYGPYGRPDMSLYNFTNSIINNKTVYLNNYGNHMRDFTYVDDIVESISRIIFKKTKKFKHKIFNIGNEKPVSLKKYVKIISFLLKKKPKIRYRKLQIGDVKSTYSNSSELYKYIKFKPKTKIEDGLKKYVEWYKNYYEKNYN